MYFIRYFLRAKADVGIKNYQTMFEFSTYARCIVCLFIEGFTASINLEKRAMRMKAGK